MDPRTPAGGWLWPERSMWTWWWGLRPRPPRLPFSPNDRRGGWMKDGGTSLRGSAPVGDPVAHGRSPSHESTHTTTYRRVPPTARCIGDPANGAAPAWRSATTTTSTP